MPSRRSEPFDRMRRHAGTSPVESILSPCISGKLELSLADKGLTPRQIRMRLCATESWLHTFMQTESLPSTPALYGVLGYSGIGSKTCAAVHVEYLIRAVPAWGPSLRTRCYQCREKKGHLERKISAGTAADVVVGGLLGARDGLGGCKSCAALLRKTSLGVFSSESQPELL